MQPFGHNTPTSQTGRDNGPIGYGEQFYTWSPIESGPVQNSNVTCLSGYLQAAYRDWLCAITVPYYDDVGGLVRPCAYYADLVENRCPYMSPHGEHQYAGEPLFLSSRQYQYVLLY